LRQKIKNKTIKVGYMKYSHSYTQTIAQAPLRAIRMSSFTGALLIASLCALSSSAKAAGFDIYGGSEGTQTLHHCGWTPTERAIYTHASRNTVIIQTKLTRLGYYRGAIDGLNSRITKTAVAAFQRDYGLKIDGVVGVETSQAIGYIGNNASWVRSCRRAYDPATSRI
jgi:Putative peptidoglycan binding domain